MVGGIFGNKKVLLDKKFWTSQGQLNHVYGKTLNQKM
jgi:hypothetical protein